ncbi:chitin synthase-domain-containing protein [Fimicolochytrium jonesii]|uniref:chitin synthase-domain-containing protein n=1 Tax=Fimicolochytrium jonesii TaxID=1396493 RepID=UPI0022FDEEB1|nr:chitin synthase-domain-containing protein [Fimicolochytrium jonesii]KAI8818729.1 chitin synthase-domain-containing protein [Fimicolochytrium jonesii]
MANYQPPPGSRGGSTRPSPSPSPYGSPQPERRGPLPAVPGPAGPAHLAGSYNPPPPLHPHSSYEEVSHAYPPAQNFTPSEASSTLNDTRRSQVTGPRLGYDDRKPSVGSFQVPLPPAGAYPNPPPNDRQGGYHGTPSASPHPSAHASPQLPRRTTPQPANSLAPPSGSYPMQDYTRSNPVSPAPGRRQYPSQDPLPTRGSASIDTLGDVGGAGAAVGPGRFTTVRRKVPLKTGNFVVDFPVSERYLDMCNIKEGHEFTHLRYTAVTCDPDEFGKPESGYTLRPKLFTRDTELFIVMTMYNEDEELFAKTMTSVQKNIAYMCSDKCPYTWGPNGWQNIVVCVVSDGRTKVDKRVLSMLQVMGVYSPGLERTQVETKPVSAHLFEFTTQIAIDKELNIRTHRNGMVPVQVLFCLKEKNAKKINSHRWFFNAFGPVLNPNVCVLLDVGTKPTGTSIYHLWRAFDRDPQVGGACGEIVAELGKGWKNLLNPLVAAQNFEYKMSNILDKPLESVFGYIQVLPGAFSAYRYKALQNSTPTSGPLASYFQGENHSGQTDVFKANMYLAEDRILCFELVTKLNENWVLKYVKNASAETDVPGALPELISQRRRWLNGSFFAAVHAVTNFKLLWRSSHSGSRIAVLSFQEIYNIYNLIFSWFSVGNFYLTFHFLFQGTNNEATDPFNGAGPTMFVILRYFYIGAIVALVIASFGNRPQGSKTLYYSILVLFAILMGFLLFMGGNAVYKGIPKTTADWDNIGHKLINEPSFRDIVISLGSTYGLYFGSSVLHLDPWHCVTSMVQYLLLLPVYINVFMVYAFCNLHDISWGTKGDNVAQGAIAGTSVAVKKNDSSEAEVTVDLPLDDADELNSRFSSTLEGLVRRPEKQRSSRDRQTKIDDYFRMYRTRVVLAWIFSNSVLVIVFSTQTIMDKLYAHVDTKGGTVNPYLSFIFWSVAALSAVRFVGSAAYICQWLMEGASGAVGGKRKFVSRQEHERQHNTPVPVPGKAAH